MLYCYLLLEFQFMETLFGNKMKIHVESLYDCCVCIFELEYLLQSKIFIAPYNQNNKYKSLEATFICALTLGCNQLSVSSA